MTSVIIYLIGYFCGMAFGVALSMLIDFINGEDDDENS